MLAGTYKGRVRARGAVAQGPVPVLRVPRLAANC